MNKIIKTMQIYLILGFPFVVSLMVWSTMNPQMVNLTGNSLKFLIWNLLAYNLMAWFACLILFLSSLIIFPSVREKTLCHLANIKERDEREQYITGRAARSAYIFNLGLLIFLLFFSVFSFDVRYSPNKSVGKRGIVQIGLGFSLLQQSHTSKKEDITDPNKIEWDSTHISLSNTMIILILLVTQLSVFNLRARKERI